MKAGTHIYIEITVKDNRKKPPALYSTTHGAKITLYKPDGSVAVSQAEMDNIDLGTYRYEHQTATTDPRGFWATEFFAIDLAGTGRTKSGGFTLT